MAKDLNLTQIRYEKKGMIAYVSLDTGDPLNTYTNSTLNELHTVWMDYNEDDDLRAAILYGEGKNFCGGHNLKAT